MKKRFRTRELLKEAFKRGYKKALKEAFRNYGKDLRHNYLLYRFGDFLNDLLDSPDGRNEETYENYRNGVLKRIRENESTIFSKIKEGLTKLIKSGVEGRREKHIDAFPAAIQFLYDFLAGKYCNIQNAVEISRGGNTKGIAHICSNIIDEIIKSRPFDMKPLKEKEIENHPMFQELVDETISTVNETIGHTISWTDDYGQAYNKQAQEWQSQYGLLDGMDMDDLDYEIRRAVWQIIFKYGSSRY